MQLKYLFTEKCHNNSNIVVKIDTHTHICMDIS